MEVVATPARITRSILEHCGDIVHALVTGAAAEPDLEVALAEGHRRHVEGARGIVGRSSSWTRSTRPSTPTPPLDTLAAVSDIRFALVLRESYGWSLDQIETWMAATSRTLLLGPSWGSPPISGGAA